MNEDFDIFWLAYPLKKGKRAAERHWERIKPDLSMVMASLEMQKLERIWLKKKKEFIPRWKDGSTWVNQESWTDEYHEDFIKDYEREKQRPVREEMTERRRQESIRADYKDYYARQSLEDLRKLYKNNVNHRWLIKEVVNEGHKK